MESELLKRAKQQRSDNATSPGLFELWNFIIAMLEREQPDPAPQPATSGTEHVAPPAASAGEGDIPVWAMEAAKQTYWCDINIIAEERIKRDARIIASLAPPSDAAAMKVACREAVLDWQADTNTTFWHLVEAIDAIPVPPARTFDDGVEAAAKICEDESTYFWKEYKYGNGPGRADTYWEGQADGANACAAAIRNMKEPT